METTTGFSNTSPWSGVQPYLKYGFDQAQQNYQNNTPQYAPFQTWTPFSNQSIQGLGQVQDIAANSQLGFNAAQEANNTLTGQYLDNNPYVDQIVDRTAGDITAGVNSMFAGGNRFGSNAQQDTLANAIGDASSNIRYQNYGDERTNMQRALALSGQVDQGQYNGASQLLNVGGMLEGKQNEALQDDVNRWNFEQNQPDLQLKNYMDVISGNYGGQTQTSQSVPTYGGNSGINALGGGLTGYSLGNALNSDYGGYVGALGGGLLGLFS